MARLIGVDLPREKRLEIGLTYIFGIGRTRAKEILAATGISGDVRVKDLTDEQLVAMRDFIEGNYETEGDLRRIDSGRQPVVGVNKYTLDDDEGIEVLKVDNKTVRAEQIAKLQQLRAERDETVTQAALEKLTWAAANPDPTDPERNLLKLAIDAARARASVGEISSALEKEFGRYTAQIRTISGVYSKESGDTASTQATKDLVEKFEELEGRRPRILVAKMGQDGHDRGQKVISTAFADLGFDVDVGPLFQTPEEVARQAIEADVHVVGVSSLAAGHLTLVPALRAELDKLGRDDLMIIVGGVIPSQDFEELREHGADAIYPPGTKIPESAHELLELLIKRLEEPAA